MGLGNLFKSKSTKWAEAAQACQNANNVNDIAALSVDTRMNAIQHYFTVYSTLTETYINRVAEVLEPVQEQYGLKQNDDLNSEEVKTKLATMKASEEYNAVIPQVLALKKENLQYHRILASVSYVIELRSEEKVNDIFFYKFVYNISREDCEEKTTYFDSLLPVMERYAVKHLEADNWCRYWLQFEAKYVGLSVEEYVKNKGDN